MHVPVERLYDGFRAQRWDLRERTATRPRSARFDHADGRVAVSFDAKGENKSTVTLEHSRLADADAAERMKGIWRERLAALKTELER